MIVQQQQCTTIFVHADLMLHQRKLPLSVEKCSAIQYCQATAPTPNWVPPDLRSGPTYGRRRC